MTEPRQRQRVVLLLEMKHFPVRGLRATTLGRRSRASGQARTMAAAHISGGSLID
jgi:hypothetical protein